ncbi:ATP-binding cassette domain-containing protein [Thiolapillus sp.]|uniref:ATP-binding cassette domain-containing protein n=1 Tax=Thiolapillus sp. TaxID=2017437 RepID=UPI003AF5D82B
MSLFSLKKVSLSFGHPALLEDIDLSLGKGERICLIGRNGEGKSTLMKLITGELTADSGEIRMAQGARIARLSQEVPESTEWAT